MIRQDLVANFNHHHDRVARLIHSYVKEHEGYIKCNERKHVRYLDSSDEKSRTEYRFDYVYIDSCGECVVVYTDNTDLGECEVDYLSCDEMYDLIKSFVEDSNPKTKWEGYISYLHEWAEDHSDMVSRGMSPASFDEWCDNEAQYEEKD